MEVKKWLIDHHLVAIARRVPISDIIETAKALYKGGIRSLEITFDQNNPACIKDTSTSIALIRREFGDKIAVGAGTVLSIKQAEAAAEAGAQFALSPDMNPEIIRKVKELGMVSVPGAMTPSEIIAAWDCGADIIKLFPAGILSLEYFRLIRGPMNHIPMMAVGGIGINNAADYLDAGFCSCGIGSNLVRNDLISEKRFSEITEIAMEYAKLAENR